MAKRSRTPEEERLEVLLRAWGKEYGEAYREEPRRWHRTTSHPIAQSMEFAPGKKVRQATRQIVGRGGYARRLIVGRNAGLATRKGVPLPVSGAFVDPIPCKPRGGTGRMGGGQGVPPQLQKVERAVQQLEGLSMACMTRALCVRVQYAGDSDHADKFAKVNEKLRELSKGHAGISLAQFRDELAHARVWLHGALIDVLLAA